MSFTADEAGRIGEEIGIGWVSAPFARRRPASVLAKCSQDGVSASWSAST
jgi:hypothetical protein